MLFDRNSTSMATFSLILGGGGMTLFYQLAKAAMTRYNIALTVALTKELRILPQLALASIVDPGAARAFTPIDVVGVLSMLIGTFLYVWLKVKENK